MRGKLTLLVRATQAWIARGIYKLPDSLHTHLILCCIYPLRTLGAAKHRMSAPRKGEQAAWDEVNILKQDTSTYTTPISFARISSHGYTRYRSNLLWAASRQAVYELLRIRYALRYSTFQYKSSSAL